MLILFLAWAGAPGQSPRDLLYGDDKTPEPRREKVPVDPGKPLQPKLPLPERPAPGDEEKAADSNFEDDFGDGDLREIEETLFHEIDSMEKRLRSIRNRLKSLGLEGHAELGDPATERALPPPIGDEDQRRYALLLKREAEIEKRWRELKARDSPRPWPWDRPKESKQAAESTVEGKGSLESGKEDKSEALRSELRRVLSEMLEVRERARERQIDGLRAELDSVEKIVKERKDPEARRKLVESRLQEVEKAVNKKQ